MQQHTTHLKSESREGEKRDSSEARRKSNREKQEEREQRAEDSSTHNMSCKMHQKFLKKICSSIFSPLRCSSSIMWQSGDVVDLFLASSPSVRVARFLVDGNSDNGNCICFAEPRTPYRRLSIRPNGSIMASNEHTKGANFVVQISEEGVRFRSTVKVNSHTVYLASEKNSFCITADAIHPSSIFFVSRADVTLTLVSASSALRRPLQRWQLRRFVEEVRNINVAHICRISSFIYSKAYCRVFLLLKI